MIPACRAGCSGSNPDRGVALPLRALLDSSHPDWALEGPLDFGEGIAGPPEAVLVIVKCRAHASTLIEILRSSLGITLTRRIVTIAPVRTEPIHGIFVPYPPTTNFPIVTVMAAAAAAWAEWDRIINRADPRTCKRENDESDNERKSTNRHQEHTH